MAISDPTSLQRKYSLDGHEIEYRGLMEICQGGPEVGELFLDGERVGNDSRFGGPLLHDAGVIFIPRFTKSFFSSGFTLARVELGTGEMSLIGKQKALIYLDKIENGFVYLHTDIERTRLEKLALVGTGTKKGS